MLTVFFIKIFLDNRRGVSNPFNSNSFHIVYAAGILMYIDSK